MKKEILDILSQITEEEQIILIEKDPDQRTLYSKPGRFVIERRQMSRITQGEATAAVLMRPHPRFRDFPKHSHDYVEIMYVCSGVITHVIGGKEVPVEEGQLIILGKETSHSIKKAELGDIGMNIIISPDLIESLYRSIKKSSSLSSNSLEGVLQKDGIPYSVFSADLEIQNLMESMIYSTLCKNEANGFILMQSITLLLSYLSKGTDTSIDSDKWMGYREQIRKKILGYINSTYSSATLTEAAEMLGLSPSYLSRLTHDIFGVSFKELLMSVRFDTACAMLSTTEIPIGDIINAVGYENNSYFHKEFKKRFGMTPNAYRKGH